MDLLGQVSHLANLCDLEVIVCHFNSEGRRFFQFRIGLLGRRGGFRNFEGVGKLEAEFLVLRHQFFVLRSEICDLGRSS